MQPEKLVIPAPLLAELQQEAARTGTSVSAIVNAALRSYLSQPRARRAPIELPTFDGGRILIDITDREALDELFDRERPPI